MGKRGACYLSIRPPMQTHAAPHREQLPQKTGRTNGSGQDTADSLAALDAEAKQQDREDE